MPDSTARPLRNARDEREPADAAEGELTSSDERDLLCDSVQLLRVITLQQWIDLSA